MSTADSIGILMTLLVTVGSVLFTVFMVAVTVVAPLGLVYGIFSALAKNAAAERELLATGAAAPARIVSIGETGMYINNQPQVKIVLEVSPPDGPTFVATVNKVVSLLQIPRVQPGLLVDVRYDRSNPSRLALVGL